MKRIKILLSVLIVLFVFAVKNTYALSLSCDGEQYQCFVCEYTQGGQGAVKAKVEIRARSNGLDLYQVNSSDIKIINNPPGKTLTTSGSGIKIQDFKNGNSIYCPEKVNICVKSGNPGSTTRQFIILSGTCETGYETVTVNKTGSLSNNKPFFEKSQEEKVNEDDKNNPNGYDIPVYLDDIKQNTTFHVNKENGELKYSNEVSINGARYAVYNTSGAASSSSAYSSLKLNCFSVTMQCLFADEEKTAKAESDKNSGASDGEYLDDMGAIFGDNSEVGNCEELLGANAVQLITNIFNWIRIITPILLIVLGAIDFGKAMLASDDKQMTMAVRNFITRCIIALAIFFVPLIIYYFMNIILNSGGLISESGGICNFL